MLPSLPAVVLLVAVLQPAIDSAYAEQLARAHLELRHGRLSEAEARFRAIVREHPDDIDARIGLGMTLTRRGAWQEALDVLRGIEAGAAENADLASALARAYWRAGDHGRALEYFTSAKARAPSDNDIRSGFENTVHAYGHSIALDGFGERVAGGSEAASGSLAVSLRVAPRLHVDTRVRLQQRSGSSDVLAGGGIAWRAGRALTLHARGLAGPGNTTLATRDLTLASVAYTGAFEWGGALRAMTFADAGVVAASPMFAWDPGRWRVDARYTYSRTRFDATGETAGDHSVMLRPTWRAWQRLWLSVTYAYGIESFEVLTADRVDALGATTIAAGLRISTPLLTVFYTTWEHQRRSNATTLDRLTVSLVKSIP